MASVCGSLKNEMQLAKIVYIVALDEVDLLEINPPANFISQMITTFGLGNEMYQEIAMTSCFAKDNGQKITLSYGFVEDTQHQQIGMNFTF
jgi:hypothetical protein